MLSTLAFCQGLPDEPSTVHRPIAKKNFLGRTLTIDNSLLASDLAWRALDIYTSTAAFTDPCHCFHESDPIAPGSGKLLPTAAFQIGMFATVGVGHKILMHYHHPRLARALLIIDNGSEGITVVNNFRYLGQPRPPSPKNLK